MADTVKLLHDNDALELFNKEVKVTGTSVVERRSIGIAYSTGTYSDSHASIRSHEIGSTSVNEVIGMIDEMIATLKKEQGDDDFKKDLQ